MAKERPSIPPHQRRIYLEDISLDQALARFNAALERAGGVQPLPGEEVALADALGRITAAPVWAVVSSPNYYASAMDGVAVQASSTIGASEVTPVQLRLGSQAYWVDTGDPLPPGTDAVIMVEHLHHLLDDPAAGAGQAGERVEIMAAVAPWQHVRPMGEDLAASELIIPENHQLRPQDLAAIASAGLTALRVRRRSRVAIIPTGSELVPPGTSLKPGNIIDSNSLLLAGYVQTWGGQATRLPIVSDDPAQLAATVRQALASHDIVVINAGSSAGSEDYTASIIEELGELLVHGIAIKPGHPTVLGVAEGKPVLGIPGYPVSAALAFDLIVRPLIYRLQGLALAPRPTVKATLTRKVASGLGEDEFVRVKLGRVGERMVATPLSRGAGILMSLVRADGLLLLPRFSEGAHAGAEVTVELLRSPEEIARTIVAIGSHDMALDVLANALRRVDPMHTLSSANVGSLGGLLAIRRGEAHLAGSHLLDPASGEYNLIQVRQMLPDLPVVLVNLTYRQQGLMVPPANPKGIAGLADLVRQDVSFINRQREAGTRVLLDYHLGKLGLDPASIRGYERIEYTHLAVALAVAGSSADTGLGIFAAARALNLDFVPLYQERYDLVIPRQYYESALLKPLLSTLTMPSFQQEILALGGYDIRDMGKVMGES